VQPVIEPVGRALQLSERNIWLLAFAAATMAILYVWVWYDSARHLRSVKKGDRVPEATPPEDLDWEDLHRRAETVVNAIVAALPPEVRRAAEEIPCLYREWSDEVTESAALGIYTGFEEGKLSQRGGTILLFLGDIWEYCEAWGLEYEDEVRTTFLHELGHHLGWGEGELDERGLA
jgi:predicted Zn-dependent protease with MMP-like domain